MSTLQDLADLVGQVIHVLQVLPQVLQCGLALRPPVLPQHQHPQLLHGHVLLHCLDVIQLTGAQVEMDGHLLPLLAQPLGHHQQLLLRGITAAAPVASCCLYSIWKTQASVAFQLKEKWDFKTEHAVDKIIYLARPASELF